MLRIALTILLLSVTLHVFSQETAPASRYHSGGIIENYNVLKGNDKIKQGPYQLITRKNVAIATGKYDHDKRTGIWRFYDKKGTVNEIYNYTSQRLLYEAPVDSTKDYISYIFDKKATAKDTLTKPVKIGGIYYGYMPYVKFFKIDPESSYISAPINAFLQLLVSPNGNLAECKLIVKLKYDNSIVDTYLLKNELLDEYEKQFVPATFNHEPVTATISVLVRINTDFTISLY